MPMDEIHRHIIDTTRRFSNEVIRPRVEALDRDEVFPADLYTQMGRLGLFGITVREDYGGVGLDTQAYAYVMEELSRGYSSVADQCGLVELAGTLLSVHGTPAQRARYMPPLLRAEKRAAYCITEAEAGSDVSGIKTIAERHGSGWHLNGTKLWIHNAPVADVAFVLARTNKEAGKRGMSVFVVDCTSPGVSKGPKEHKRGQRGVGR